MFARASAALRARTGLLGAASGLAIGVGGTAAWDWAYPEERQILMMFGAPGAGKTTQAARLVERLGIPQLRPGDMLREAAMTGTDAGKKAVDFISAGEEISDDILISILEDRIKHADCEKGFILDGFPRTVQQTEALDFMLAQHNESVKLVMAFDVDEALLEERICGRWIDKRSGRAYHAKFCPPKSMQLDSEGNPQPDTMRDDTSGDKLCQRPDDTADGLESRLQSYRNYPLRPVLEHYAPKNIVMQVDASKLIDEVWSEVAHVLP